MFSPKSFFALPFLFALSVPTICAAPQPPAKATASATQTLTRLPASGLPATWLQGAPVKQWEQDKVYVFEFWATWCGPCLAAIPHLESIHKKVTQEGLPVQIVGVNVRDKTSPEKLLPFLGRQRTKPTYTIAVDTEQTVDSQWLKPLKAIGIPFTVAVKNGEILWKGHPARLTVDMVKAMTLADFTAESLGKDPALIEAEAKKRVQAIDKLYADNKLEEAEAALLRFVADSSIPSDFKISALEIPCYKALHAKDFAKLNACLRRQAEAIPNDYRNRILVTNFILTTDDIPEDQRDIALALECLKQADILSKNQRGQRSSVQSRLAEIYEARGEHDAALDARKKAWEFSHENAHLERLRETLSKAPQHADALKLLDDLLAGKASVPEDFLPKRIPAEIPVPAATSAPLIPSQSAESAQVLEALRSLKWIQGNCPETLPQNGLVFIDFWAPPPPGPYNRLTMRRPAAWLDEKTKCISGTTTYVIALTPDHARVSDVLAFPRYATTHAVAVADSTQAPALKLFNIRELPTSLALRDGKIIWSGNAQTLPEWVVQEASKPDYDHTRAEALRAEKQKEFTKTLKIIGEARKLSYDGKFEAARERLESVRPTLERDPTLELLTQEIFMVEPYTHKNFEAVGSICEAMLNKYPTLRGVAEHQIKLLNSNVDLHAATLPVLIHACKNIIATGTPYESAYWEFIAQYYEEAGQMNEAVYAAIMARNSAEKFQALQAAEKR